MANTRLEINYQKYFDKPIKLKKYQRCIDIVSAISYPLYHVTTTHPRFFDKEYSAVEPGTNRVSATFGRTFLDPRPSSVEDNGKEGNLIFAGADLKALIQTGMLFKTSDVFATRLMSGEGQIFVSNLNDFVSSLDHIAAIIKIPIQHSSKFVQECDTMGNLIDKYTSTQRIPITDCEIEDVNLFDLARKNNFVVYFAKEGLERFSQASGFRFGVGEHIGDEHIKKAVEDGALIKISMEDLMLQKAATY